MAKIEIRNQIIDMKCDVIELRNKITKIILNIIEQMDDEIDEEFDETICNKIVDFVIDKIDYEDEDELFDLVHEVVYKVYEKLVGFWETLKYDDDYEINTKYPYQIRKKSTGKILCECVNSSGYVHLAIKTKKVKKHRLIAIQWIENDYPETKIQIDHIDRDKLNNHISNLRWITPSDNCRNRNYNSRSTEEFVDELPNDSMLIESYNNHSFDKYFYDHQNDRILMFTRYEKIKICKPYTMGNRLVMQFYDISGKQRIFGFEKLMKYLRDN